MRLSSGWIITCYVLNAAIIVSGLIEGDWKRSIYFFGALLINTSLLLMK
jgi:hypothetical protein